LGQADARPVEMPSETITAPINGLPGDTVQKNPS
jgi:hypothetical protein